MSQISEVSPTAEHTSVDSINIKRNNKVIQFKITTKSTTSISSGARLGTVPSGYRPHLSVFGLVFTYSNGKPINGSVWIDGSGAIIYYGDTVSVQAVMFMTYVAGQ